MRSGRTRVVLALIPVVLTCAAAASSSVWQDYEILSQDERHITFSARLPDYELKTVTVDENTYTRIKASGLVPFADEGQPDLPAFAVVLAVPRGARARLEGFSVSDESVVEGVRVIPMARAEGRGEWPDVFAVDIYEEDESIYDGDSPFPERQVWLTDRGSLRHQQVVRAFISPFIYEPDRQRLTITRQFTVTVTFEGPTGIGAPPMEDRWERVYKQVLLNYEQGRRWRVRRTAPLMRGAVTNDRLKILIAATGLHKLEFDSVSVAGFPEGVATDELFLYRDEFREGMPDTIDHEGTPDTLQVIESAIEIYDHDQDGFFSSGDEIIFFAQDFYDQFGYRGDEDLFFDKNVYWLSWGPGSHARITSRPGWREDSSPVKPPTFSDILHKEEDIVFSNFPPQHPSWEPFDLFYWDKYRVSFPFDLPGVDSNYVCSLVVNLISYYDQPSGKRRDPYITILAQGCSGGMDEIITRKIYVPSAMRLTYELGAGYFCEEGNIFRIESQAASTASPGHTVDWFEILYERNFKAYGDILRFTNAGITGELEFEVEDFSTSDIEVFDITDPTVPVKLDIPPGNILPDDGAFKITFRDSVAGDKRYFSRCTSVVNEVGVEQLSLIEPPSLRDVAGSYLMISYPDFMGELAPLIAKREEQGHTVVLVTPQTIYDDFGNGMKSDVAIRRFIKHGFLTGGSEFVLLVGDANVDRRGLILEPRPGQVASMIDYIPSHNRIFTDLLEPPNWEIRPNDNWFVLADGPGDDYPDLYIGRLSVGSAEETAGVVGKILTFEDYEGDDPWKKRIGLIADDEFGDDRAGYPTYIDCFKGQHQFKDACENAALIARNSTVVPLDTVKYFLERCTKDDQPELRCREFTEDCCTDSRQTKTFVRDNCTADALSLMDAGALLINYQGHSNRWLFTHESLVYDRFYDDDVRSLSNRDKPFVFLGFGCWISDFQWRNESVNTIGDAIGERFLLSPNGAACASFASGCSEPISQNEVFNDYVARAIFTDLQGFDPHGNAIPARILMGEAVMTALVRFGETDYIQAHILLGDPAMVIDMGAPLIKVSVEDSVIDQSYVFEGATFDTLAIVAEIKDEEAIISIEVELVEDGQTTIVPPGAYSEVALMDEGFTRSRAYEVTYDHVPRLGDYLVRISGTDYADKVSSFDIHVATGSAEFFADAAELEEGERLVIGQHLRVVLTRPVAFLEEDIEVLVDSIPASEFADYSVEMKDAEGKEWEVSFIPSLTAGDHVVSASAEGFAAERGFQYIPAEIDFFVNGKPLYDGDFVSSHAEFEIDLRTERAVTKDDIEITLDEEPVDFAFAPHSSGWRLTFDLELEAGDYELAITLFSMIVATTFQVSEDLMLTDVSVFPNPFSSEAVFFYTLSQDVSEVELSIFTVSGRLILERRMTPLTSYNDFVWDGRDARGNRVANGTYLYRVVARSGSDEKEFTGWVVKLE